MGTNIRMREMKEVKKMEKERNNKMGRPKTPEYRKKRFRFSAIEDRFKERMSDFKNDHDRKLVEKILDDMRAAN